MRRRSPHDVYDDGHVRQMFYGRSEHLSRDPSRVGERQIEDGTSVALIDTSMWPWGHLAVGYLSYTLFSRVGIGRSPTASTTLAVAVGTQFPDLIDKPLAWTFGILASGRSLAHSLLIASAVIVLVSLVSRRQKRSSLAIAFGIGYLSHLVADAVLPLARGEYQFITFLGWPITRPPLDSEKMSFISQFMSMEFTPFFILQLVLVGVAAIVWWYDDAPGLQRLRRWTIHSGQRTE